MVKNPRASKSLQETMITLPVKIGIIGESQPYDPPEHSASLNAKTPLSCWIARDLYSRMVHDRAGENESSPSDCNSTGV